MILGPDKARLSKRHGATSVLAYRDMGYLPHALLNALVRLGWSYGDQEKFSVDELIEKFSLDHVGKAAGVFNAEKLLDLNARYIRESEDTVLARQLVPFLNAEGIQAVDAHKAAAVVPMLKPRSRTLVDMAQGARFCFEQDVHYEEKGDRKFLTPDVADLLIELKNRLATVSPFDHGTLEQTFVAFLNDNTIKLKKIAQPLRVALTGKTASPGIFEVMAALGRETVIERIHKAVVHIQEKGATES